MSVFKDLLFTKDNIAADIARCSAAGSVLLYWGCVVYQLVAKGEFHPAEVGGGLAAIFSASAAWIYFRQKSETGGPSAD